jgi:predicted nucleic-acid-binding Zn-ribbon protein
LRYDIKALVKKLYDPDQKEYADKICNRCGENGFYFLKDLYLKNQGYTI